MSLMCTVSAGLEAAVSKALLLGPITRIDGYTLSLRWSKLVAADVESCNSRAALRAALSWWHFPFVDKKDTFMTDVFSN